MNETKFEVLEDGIYVNVVEKEGTAYSKLIISKEAVVDAYKEYIMPGNADHRKQRGRTAPNLS